MFKGVLLSVVASCMFGVLYFLPTVLQPLDGQEIFGWRILMTAPLLTLTLRATGQLRQVRELARRVRERPLLLAVLLASSGMLGLQQWLFTWAPTHGHAMNVALAYFLMPLVMVLVGVVAFGERLSRARMLAVLFALLGVVNELFRVGTLAWSTLVPALGFPAYFALRRWAKTDTTGGMWFELVLLLPVAALFALRGPNVGATPGLVGPLLIMGGIGGTALLFYLLASQRLPFNLFGLLGYLEPVLLVVVALSLLGARIEPREWLTYVPIWIAVALLVLEGAASLRHRRRAPTPPGEVAPPELGPPAAPHGGAPGPRPGERDSRDPPGAEVPARD
mgnify:CR=1 FL=1